MIHILDGQTDALLGYLDGNGDKVFWDDEIEQDVEGLNILQFKMLSSTAEALHMKDLNRLLVPHERGGWQEFVIHESEISNDTVFVSAVGSESGMNGRKVILPATHAGFTLKQYVNLATSGTEWVAGNVEYAGIKTLTYDTYQLPYDFLKRIETAFKVELSFHVEIEGNRVIGRYVNVVERIGNNRGKEYVDAVDLINVSKRIYNDRIVTGLFAQGPEKEDGSPRISTYVEDEEAFQRWNFKKFIKIDIYEPETDDLDMTMERLTSLAKTALKKRIDSVVEYTIDVVGDEESYLGDTVRIKDEEFNPPLYAEARIINVRRSIKRVGNDLPVAKTHTIGEVVEFTEDEIKTTFRALQRLYGTKLLKGPIEPPGQSNAIWINTAGTLDVPYTYNTQTLLWEKYAPTDAGEIGGLVVGQQYNGVSITPEDGMVVDRTDGLVETIVNATEGITIQSRPDDLAAFRKVFFVDEFGSLTFAGIARGAQVYLGGLDNEDGVLIIYGADGIPVGEINSATGTFNFPSLSVTTLFAPNVADYADYRNETRIIRVAEKAEPTLSVGTPSDDNTGDSWASPLRTIGEALRRIPPIFKGIVDISLVTGHVFYEDVDLSGFGGGGKIIVRNSSTSVRPKVVGDVRITSNSNFGEWREVDIDSTNPVSGIACLEASGLIVDCHINGAAGNTDFGVSVTSGANFQLNNVTYSNCKAAVRTSYGGEAHVVDNGGSVTGFAFVAFGGKITGSGTAPTGASGNVSELAGGQITGSWTFPAPPAAPAPIGVTTKTVWSANSDSGTYRTDFGGFWDTGSNYGNSATQGKWDVYGIFTGSWFFGSGLSAAVTGRTIKSIRIYTGRLTGGSGSATTVKFRPHTSNTRPGGNVSLQAPEYSVGFKPGENKWVTLPTSFHAGFANGTYKGISVYSGTSNYAKMIKAAKIEITYE